MPKSINNGQISHNYSFEATEEKKKHGCIKKQADLKGQIQNRVAEAKKSLGRFDPKRLAMILGDSFIGGTGLDGGLIQTFHADWEKVFDRINNGKSLLKPEMSAELKGQIITDQQTLVDSEDFIRDSSLSDLREAIKSGIKDHGRYAMAATITGTKTDPTGHVFVITFQKEGDRVIAHILNKGEGSHLHEMVKVEGKVKRDPAYTPIDLGSEEEFNSNFLGEKGRPFFDALVTYATRLAPDQEPYSSTEIYRRLEAYGTLVPGQKGEEIPLRAGTSQRSGTCAVQALRLPVRDHLASQKEQDAYRHLMLCQGVEILFDALVALEKGEPISLELVENCLRAFQAKALKGQEGVLSEKEVAMCAALSELIEEQMAKARENRPPVGRTGYV